MSENNQLDENQQQNSELNYDSTQNDKDGQNSKYHSPNFIGQNQINQTISNQDDKDSENYTSQIIDPTKLNTINEIDELRYRDPYQNNESYYENREEQSLRVNELKQQISESAQFENQYQMYDQSISSNQIQLNIKSPTKPIHRASTDSLNSVPVEVNTSFDQHRSILKNSVNQQFSSNKKAQKQISFNDDAMEQSIDMRQNHVSFQENSLQNNQQDSKKVQYTVDTVHEQDSISQFTTSKLSSKNQDSTIDLQSQYFPQSHKIKQNQYRQSVFNQQNQQDQGEQNRKRTYSASQHIQPHITQSTSKQNKNQKRNSIATKLKSNLNHNFQKIKQKLYIVTRRKTLSDDEYQDKNSQSVSFLTHFIFKDTAYYLTIATIIVIGSIYFNNYAKVLCSNDKNVDEQYQCQSSHEKFVQYERLVFFYIIGACLFLQSNITENFDYKYQDFFNVLFTLLYFFLAVTQFVVYVPYYYIHMFGWLTYILNLYVIKKFKKQNRINWWVIIYRQMFTMIFFSLFTLYDLVIKRNVLGIPVIINVLLGNGIFIAMKSIMVKVFIVKVSQDITKFEDVRIMIGICYILDQGIVFNAVLTEKIEDLYFVYFNFIVLIVYNTTQFHLYFYISKKMILKFWECIFRNRFQRLKNIIIYLFVQMWVDFDNFLLLIDKKVSNKKVKLEETDYNEYQIKRVVATYYLITYFQVFVYFSLVMIYNRYIPYCFNFTQFENVINNREKYIEQQIDQNVFLINAEKFFLTFGIYFGTVGLVLVYAQYKQLKFFSMMKLNKQSSAFHQILVKLFFYGLITYTAFAKPIQVTFSLE